MIPLLRKKVANIRRRSGLDPDGFDGKILAHVLASYPRDELFQSSEDELFANAMAITQIHERRRTRVFLRRDRYGLFYTCLVFMPRELYNTQLRVRIQQLLMAKLGAEDAPFDAYFSESILVRLQFVIRVPPGTNGAGGHRRTAAFDRCADARLVAGRAPGAAAGMRRGRGAAFRRGVSRQASGGLSRESFAARGGRRHSGHGAAERSSAI